MSIAISIALGIITGLLANAIWQQISHLQSRRKYGKFELSGVWGEYIPQSEGRQFSIGELQYSNRRKIYTFDGINYWNNGTPFCHWTTTASHLDKEGGALHYMFNTSQFDTPGITTTGYGVINLTRNETQAQSPQDGFYAYTKPNQESATFGHTLKKLDTEMPKRSENVTALLKDNFPEFTGSQENPPTASGA